jgi:hypothetical protein
MNRMQMIKSSPYVVKQFALAAVLTLLAQPLLAATATQSANLSASNAGSLYNGTGSANLVNSGFFSTDMLPFKASLGTLQSFTVKWEVGGLLSATSGPAGGNASGTLGGTFMINGCGYSGGGGGNGNGAGPDQPFDVIFPMPSIVSEQTFSVADAGVGYDPAILAAVTNATPLAVSFDSAATVTYGTVVNLAASVTGKVSLTYTYAPPPGGTTIIYY